MLKSFMMIWGSDDNNSLAQLAFSLLVIFVVYVIAYNHGMLTTKKYYENACGFIF
jgi:hypothetical protein